MTQKETSRSRSSSSSSSTMHEKETLNLPKDQSSHHYNSDDEIDVEARPEPFRLHSTPLEPIRSNVSKQPVDPLTSTLSKTLSRIRTSDTLDPGPAPDGGLRAWSQACLTHLVIFNTWGFINSFGLFQTYYVTNMKIGSNSEVAWIGSIQVWILFGIGAFSGRALDAGFFKLVFSLGSVIALFGMFMLSLSSTYYQVFLAQGVCMGLGFGLVFVPSVALCSTYFLKRRAAALGVAVTGTATGGLVFPAIAQQMLPSVGFGWTVRTMAFVQMAGFLLCAILLKPRFPPRKAGPVIEWSAFKELPYTLYLTGAFFMFWSVYIGFFYVGAYAKSTLGMSEADSISLLFVLNGVGVVGRLGVNFIADHLGPMNMLVPFVAATSLLAYCWIAVHSITGVWVFTAMYGITASGLQGLFPVVLTSLTTNPKKVGTRTGMGFACVGFAVLTGPAIAGALIEQMNGSYLACQIYAGTSMLVSTLILTMARWAVLRQRGLGWKWAVKV